ncbi:unnamed protein product, partial [marine sediment metagenome]
LENRIIELEKSESGLKKKNKELQAANEKSTATNKVLKEKEKRPQVSEKKYHLLTDSLLDGIYEFDLKGKFIYVNKTIVDMLGYSKDEALNNIRINDIIIDEGRISSRKAIDEILKGKTIVGERTFIRKDGTRFTG